MERQEKKKQKKKEESLLGIVSAAVAATSTPDLSPDSTNAKGENVIERERRGVTGAHSCHRAHHIN